MRLFSHGVLRGTLRPLSLLACAPLLVASATAHADSFAIDGTLQSGATIKGTVSVDLSSQKVLGTDITVTGAGLTGLPQIHDPGEYYGSFLGPVWEFSASYLAHGPSGVTSGLDILAYPTSLPSGGALCSLSAPCASFGASQLEYGLGSYDKLQAGTITPIAAAPEPASLALLGTGVLAAFGAARRRLRS